MASEFVCFLIVNKPSPEYIHDLVNIKDSTYNFRNERTAEVPRVTASSHFGSRLSEYGTVSQMKSDSQILILISGD